MNKKNIFFFIIFSFPVLVSAQYFFTPPALFPYLKDAPEIVSRAAVLIDAETGTLLYSKNPDVEIPPASLTKLMTMHLVMNAVYEGRTSLDTLVPITVESWAQSQPRGSSLMFLEPGQNVTLREIMLGMAVSSGNDAATAAALHLAPTVADFTAMMTAEARRMGLNVTRFTDASGISSRNRTTAAEFALFSRQYVSLHPQNLYEFHSVLNFSYPLAANMPAGSRANASTIVQNNSNSLLRTFPGVNGLKTGYIGASGYNISLTAERDDQHFILVVMGAPSQTGGNRIRDEDSARILTWAFDNFKTVRPVFKSIGGTVLFDVPLWKGKNDIIELKLAEPADFISHNSRADSIKYEVISEEPLIAPLPAEYPAGYLSIYDDYGELYRIPLVTAAASERGNIFKRFWHSILLLFRN